MGAGRGKKFPGNFTTGEEQQMNLIDRILRDDNITASIERVAGNNGAPGIDGMTVKELYAYFDKHGEEIKAQIREKRYQPQPVRRVYIPKPNSDKQRPLGIPTAVDRVIQEAVSRILMKDYDPYFSDHSYGYRPRRSCHDAMKQALEYLNEGRTWVVDFDIEKYFDTVNHDKLISILRERINDATVLHLIRSFLRAGVMEDGLVSPTEEGVPQGGQLSCVLSNVYLDKLDKELEQRGLCHVRYADDFAIYVKSEKSANRVMSSVSSWLERKLFLKVSATKTKVVRPMKSEFLGFGFWKSGKEWRCKPLMSRKKRLRDKIRAVTCRRKAAAVPLTVTVTKVNQILRGWINYYCIGSMKGFMQDIGPWVRHRIRVIMVKQWKKPRTIMKNLKWYCWLFKFNFSDEEIFKVANSRKGLYAQCNGDIINYILSPKVLSTKLIHKRKTVYPGLIDPLAYYLSRI